MAKGRRRRRWDAAPPQDPRRWLYGPVPLSFWQLVVTGPLLSLLAPGGKNAVKSPLTLLQHCTVNQRLGQIGVTAGVARPFGPDVAETRASWTRCSTSLRSTLALSCDLCSLCPTSAQAFPPSAASGPLAQHFRPCRHRLSAPAYRQEMENRFQIWREIAVPALAA
jgi:hypothetical protein